MGAALAAFVNCISLSGARGFELHANSKFKSYNMSRIHSAHELKITSQQGISGVASGQLSS
jgi:hypothetical protein